MRSKTSRKNQTPGAIAGAAFLSLLCTVLAVAIPAPALAHPPQEIVLSYDRGRQMLEVRITHSSKDPAAHYIGKVEIRKNGQPVSVNEYKSQPDQPIFSQAYPVGAAGSDVIEVTATCNKFGSKRVKLTVP